MSTNQQAIDAAAEVEAARARLNELITVESALAVKLPAARAALQAAEKRLRGLTKPTKAASRKHQIDLLNTRLQEAKENA